MSHTTSRRRVIAAIAAVGTAVGTMIAAAPAASADPGPDSGQAGCRLTNGIQHVVRIMFDNVHLTRDDPNVPSDLEQMPALRNFITRNGVMMANDHNVLVHTATNFISNLTGLYPDRTAVTQSNTFNYYDSAGNTHPGVSFAYWTDPIYDYTGANLDTNDNLQYTANRATVPNDTNVNVPAPWVPYTRDGCNVGEVGMANTVLENIDTDIPTVFGADSPQAAEAAADPDRATADFVGYAVHCARTSRMCSTGQTDSLPDEPGGYSGFKALFGNSEVQPVISPSGPVKALDGSTIGTTVDGAAYPGFPGFDSLTPANALGYGAQMLENGVQVANIYVSDVHGDHTGAGQGDLGPGSQLYEQQLADYNTAFGQFFARLSRDGITPANTLFVVTTDEGDHFSGSEPTPAGCTGLHGNYCHYATRSEVNVNLPGMLADADGDTTPFSIHADPAPALWVNGQPARDDPAVRTLARNISALDFTNPLTGVTEPVAYYLADPVEEKILHFVSSDPARTPTLTLFSGEDSYVGGGGACTGDGCVYTTGAGYAWNHGSLWPDMQDIWAGYVGPGISARGTNTSIWTDQVDTRPTMLALTGLRDDYVGDGRVLVEICSPAALPGSLRAHRHTVLALGESLKQILGSAGTFAMDTLSASTRALASGSASGDSTYTGVEDRLIALNNWRDRLAGRISAQLDGAEFAGRPIDERTGRALDRQARQLLGAAQHLAQG